MPTDSLPVAERVSVFCFQNLKHGGTEKTELFAENRSDSVIIQSSRNLPFLFSSVSSVPPCLKFFSHGVTALGYISSRIGLPEPTILTGLPLASS